MEPEKKHTRSLLDRLKQKALDQPHYGGDAKEEAAKLHVRDCPNCGAGRAQHEGLTHCAYCGFEFMSVTLSNGIHIQRRDNSKKP